MQYYSYEDFKQDFNPKRFNLFIYIYALMQVESLNSNINLSYANLFNPTIEEAKEGRIIRHNRFMPKGILVVDEILPQDTIQKEKEAFGDEMLKCWRLQTKESNFYALRTLEDARIVLAPRFMDKRSIMDAVQDYEIKDQEACQALTLAYKELFYPEFLVVDRHVYIKEQYKIKDSSARERMFWVNLIYVENFFYDDEYYSEDHTIEFAQKIVKCWNIKLHNEGLDSLAKAIMIDDEEDGVFVSIVPANDNESEGSS